MGMHRGWLRYIPLSPPSYCTWGTRQRVILTGTRPLDISSLCIQVPWKPRQFLLASIATRGDHPRSRPAASGLERDLTCMSKLFKRTRQQQTTHMCKSTKPPASTALPWASFVGPQVQSVFGTISESSRPLGIAPEALAAQVRLPTVQWPTEAPQPCQDTLSAVFQAWSPEDPLQLPA